MIISGSHSPPLPSLLSPDQNDAPFKPTAPEAAPARPVPADTFEPTPNDALTASAKDLATLVEKSRAAKALAAALTDTPATTDARSAQGSPAAQTPRRASADTADSPAAEEPSAQTPLRRVFNAQDRDALLAAWGATAGSERYATEYDLDGDGVIGSADLAQLLGSFANAPAAPPRAGTDPAPSPGKSDTLQSRVLKAWGSRDGDAGFDATLDLNGDGAVNAQDLAAALGGQPAPAARARVYTSDDLGQLLKSWGSKSGETGFAAAYDFDADGSISSTDLAGLLGRLADQARSRNEDRLAAG